MKILILGHKGMLGKTALKYFSSNEKYCIATIDAKYSLKNNEYFLEEIQKFNPDVILNAIGKIKQKNPDTYEMYLSNSYLPHCLAENLKKEQVLVHASTDCVFSGLKIGGYEISDNPDPSDDYGLSKFQAESIKKLPNCLVVRTSIIGIEDKTNYGLLSWFLSRDKGVEIRGFKNHKWSGITTLEWCKVVEKLLALDARGLHHISTNSTSKFDLLNIFKKVFEKEISIISSNDEKDIDRTILGSTVKVESIQHQLIELRSFWNKV